MKLSEFVAVFVFALVLAISMLIFSQAIDDTKAAVESVEAVNWRTHISTEREIRRRK